MKLEVRQAVLDEAVGRLLRTCPGLFKVNTQGSVCLSRGRGRVVLLDVDVYFGEE